MISVEELGKKYSLRHMSSEPYMAMRDVIARKATQVAKLINPFTLAGQLRKTINNSFKNYSDSDEDFWALRDVSFEISRSERVGIIGRNGAGKSTLLKILSRITEPTTGRVVLGGRVASLLEVGTGFHPELTGRENIFLNGAILGMTRREIRSKFDEIVEFAEVERFLDTPVKRYSSGMYVRLAFSVAAHLEPDILVVDEVLAVGDSAFQAKCLNKLELSSSKEEKTILFVSHNLSAISRLCDRAIVLRQGNLIYDAATPDAVSFYGGLIASDPGIPLSHRRDRKGSLQFRFTEIRIYGNTSSDTLSSGDNIDIELILENNEDAEFDGAIVSVGIVDSIETPIMLFRSSFYNQSFLIRRGRNTIKCSLSKCPLADGEYYINLYVETPALGTVDWVERAMTIKILPGDFFKTGSNGLPQNCKILHKHRWE